MQNKSLIYIIVILLLAGFGIYWIKTHPKKPIIAEPVPDFTQLPPLPKEEKKQEPEKLKEIYSYQEGLEVAKKLNRHVFMFFTAEWCTWCNKMKKETFTNAEIKDLTKNYIIIYVDADKEKEVNQKYQVKGIPAYFMLDGQGRVVKTGAGFKNTTDFKQWLTMAAVVEN
jgi:thioredoxin-related protein